MTTVLLVDDDPILRRTLSLALRSQGWESVAVPDGASAMAAVARVRPDLLLLDLGLPDLDGMEVLRAVRSWTQLPVIVLSARQDQADKVQALDAGADDYLGKPFGTEELFARIRAALRRAAPPTPVAPGGVVHAASFDVDLDARVVRDGGGLEVRLTPTEWGLIEVLARASGRVVDAPVLLKEVWGPAYGTETHYLRVFIAQLRRKLEPDPANPVSLLTEPGRGYRLVPHRAP
jgi:two-component system KDP operon response regulator KdpE